MGSRRFLSRRVAAVALTVGLTLSNVAAVSASDTTDHAKAAAGFAAFRAAAGSLRSSRLGAGYLARQIDANGGYVESYGFPDVSGTANAVLGLNAAGVGGREVKAAIRYLKTQLDQLRLDDGTDNPGLLAYFIMAAVSSRQDPYHFGGHRPVNNLVARLLKTVRTTGSDRGLFGTADPTYDGSFRQGISLAALAAAGVRARTVKHSIGWLEAQQCANGLWESYRSDTSVACPSADPDTFAGPDTNSTGAAVQGLAAYGLHPRKFKVVASMRAIQTSDGGYPYLAAPGQTSDPDSTALGIQTLLAERAFPGAAALGALKSFQLDCSAPAADRGAYFYPGYDGPNTLATTQGVIAAALKTLPIGRSWPSNAVPVEACPATTSASATSAATIVAKTALAGTLGAGLVTAIRGGRTR